MGEERDVTVRQADQNCFLCIFCEAPIKGKTRKERRKLKETGA